MEDEFPSLVDLAEVARTVHEYDDEVVTVMAGSADRAGHDSSDYWARMSGLLDSLRDKGTSCVRLVMSGAGDEQPDRLSLARRIADAWEMEVIAPDGVVLIAPGGALFVLGSPGAARGWWRFAPGERPRPLGPRAPAPVWQESLNRVPARTAGGCVVDQIPAGIHVRQAGASEPGEDDLCFAMPVHPERPVLLVGAPQAEDVAADEVAAVLAALPAAERSRFQLAPGGRRDLLRLAQSVADMLGSDVEVLTGIPLLSGNSVSEAAVRPTLVGSDGEPTWQPYVTAVACSPVDGVGKTPAPRLVHSYPLVQGAADAEHETMPLTDQWYAVATRAGVAVGELGGPRPSLTAMTVDPDTLSVELGTPGAALDESVLPALSQLLTSLGPETRARTTLLVRGTLPSGEGGLRQLASEQGVLGLRYLTGGDTGPVSSGQQPGEPSSPTDGRPRPDAEGRVPTAVAPPAVDLESATVPTAPDPEATRPPADPAQVPELSGQLVGTGGASAFTSPAAPETAGVAAGAVGGAGGRGPRRIAGVGDTSSPPRPAPAPRIAVTEARSQEPVPTPAAPATGAGGSRPDDTETVGELVAGVLTAGSGEPPSSGDASSSHGSVLGTAGDPSTSGPPVAEPDDGADRGEAIPGEVKPGAVDPGDRDGRGGSAEGLGADGPAASEPPSKGPESGGREPAPAAQAPQPSSSGVPVPFAPGHVSSAAERAAFRELASDVWEVHGAAVSRVLTRMPALRGQELEAARADLVALLAYLTTEEGPLLPRALVRDLHRGDGRLLPYAACIASALRRLPSYRGVALRAAESAEPAEAGHAEGEPRAGALLLSPGPVSSLAMSSVRPGGVPVRYGIWSVTGRKVRQLLDRPGGAKDAPEEIVFAPGTGFRVLGSRTVHGSPVILLRELPATAASPTPFGDGVEELSQLDRVALSRLEAALGREFPTEGGADWPERCIGPLGSGG
ncbi:hypothetical protein ACFYWY_08570 [Streptomyces sp. NPDC002870]|uniref:hypothetical protein n=1 Tax=Streptomyces sp. NPDC002870 TaxID=3364666 RepID=UPI0036CA9520